MPLPPVAGTLQLDINPASWGLTNGTALTFANSGLTPVSGNPTFRTPVFDTGAPAAQTVFGSSGFSVPRPVQDDFSIYAVVKDPFTTTFNSGGGFSQNASLIDGEVGGFQNDYAINYRSDGVLSSGTGRPGFVDSSAEGTHTIATGTHVITAIRVKATGSWKVYVDGVLDISIATLNTASLTAPTNLFFGIGSSVGRVGCYYGRVLAYDAAHNGTDQAAVESYLLTNYGESVIMRASKAVTYVPVGPPLLLSTTKAVMYVVTGPDLGARQRMKVRYLRGHQ